MVERAFERQPGGIAVVAGRYPRRTPERLLGGVAVESLGGGVPQRDVELRVRGDHGVGHRLHEPRVVADGVRPGNRAALALARSAGRLGHQRRTTSWLPHAWA